jgi:hypothetical protein
MARAMRLPRDDSGSVCVRAVAVAGLEPLSKPDRRDAAGLWEIAPSQAGRLRQRVRPLSARSV